MNDLTTLYDAWGAPAAPSETARAQARAALLERAARKAPGRRFRLGLRIAVVGALALAVAGGVQVADDPRGDGTAVPVAAAAVLERAAVVAETRPFTPPRDDQWIYFEDRFTTFEGVTETQRSWHRADGGGMAWIDEHGQLQVHLEEPPRNLPGRPRPQLFDGYRALAALPTDPDALLRWAYAQAANVTGAGLSEHGDVYAIFNGMVRGNVLPPELEAAIFRGLKQVPGVTVETVEVLGRPALALGQTEDWLREELLLDRETYTYRGERSTVVRDATIDPLKAGNATGEVKKGSKVVSARVATAIVDEPGERPQR